MKRKTTMEWFNLESPKTKWLVFGLVTCDSQTAVTGKPKAGKSSFCRHLITCVVKGTPLLGRAIDTSNSPGRVLYIHLDRKDAAHRISTEFKQMGITTKEEAERIIFRTASEIPDSFTERLAWLQAETKLANPHLIVIDLLWHFIVVKNANDYNAVLDAINKLQDSLIQINYTGALVVTMHGRKATNVNDRFDDILGSTGQRGSFSTNIILERHRNEDLYTITSDQTDRDTEHGEIDETIIERDGMGRLSLLGLYADRKQAEKKDRDEALLLRLVEFISQNEGCDQTKIITELEVSKRTALNLVARAVADGQIARSGVGIKGNPFLYSIHKMETLQRPEVVQHVN
jgi:RecA-family ATPase